MRLGGGDCRPPGSWGKDGCQGRDRDDAGKRIPCTENGFIGVPLTQLSNGGNSALRYTVAELRPAYDGRKGPSTWRAPALKPEGAQFKPSNAATGVPVGTRLSWDEVDRDSATREVKRRSGQVWSGCRKKAGAVWVAPDDGGPAVALCTKTLDVLR